MISLSLISVSIFLSKSLHLYAHLYSISAFKFLLWGSTFFLQDILVVLFVRWLVLRSRHKRLEWVTAVATTIFSLLLLFMASVNLAFYSITGTEIHWRQVTSFPMDAAGRSTMFHGATACGMSAVLITAIATLLASPIHRFLSYLLSCVVPVFTSPWTSQDRRAKFEILPLRNRTTSGLKGNFASSMLLQNQTSRKGRGVILCFSSIFVLLQLIRPSNSEYIYLSWTLPLSFLSDIGREERLSISGDDSPFWRNCNVLAPSPRFDWLPAERLEGFQDWYGNSTERIHYSSSKDCLHTPNLATEFLQPLSSALRNGEVKVKHVMMLKLESTRKDVFPLVKGSSIWKRIAKTYPGKEIPPEMEGKLSQLTKTAAYFTGEDTGFPERDQTSRSRGGITASNAATTSTYTLKSVIGSLCGIIPLTADYNQELYNHIYQPCVAHILEVFNKHNSLETMEDDFRSWPWKSMWMQSSTDSYDSQYLLTSALGFNISIARNELTDPDSPHYSPTSKDVNYFGLPDGELEPYLRDAIQSAKKSHERLFIAHLTSTTHHPWGLPAEFDSQKYVNYKSYGTDRMFNRYLNTIGYADTWLDKILTILDESGIANETLIVIAGDHGVSLPTDGSSTPYNNPHESTTHVPLIFSHPSLPPVQISSPVSTVQILPTILDLLVSSSSLNAHSEKIATDLMPLYEGQSLLRQPVLSGSGHDLDFSVLNPGGSSLAVRSRARPDFRLVVPLSAEEEWRFTHVGQDPDERNAILEYNWLDLKSQVGYRYGKEAVTWLEEVVGAVKWWLPRNRELWRFEGDARVTSWSAVM